MPPVSIPLRRVARRVVRALAVAAGVWCVLAIISLVFAARDARSARAHLREARDTLTPEGLLAGDGLDLLVSARLDLASAHGAMASPLLWPARALPGIGEQIGAGASLTGSAVDVLDAGIVAVRDASDAVEGARSGGRGRVDAMRRIADVAAEARGRLDEVDLDTHRPLSGPLRRARDDFDDDLGDLHAAVDRLHTAASGIATFLEGPRTYMVFAANTNEMRVGSGTFLSAGLLFVEEGRLSLTSMRPTAALRLGAERAAGVRMDPDVEDLWGWLKPNDEWRNLGVTPRFDETARMSVEMADALEPGSGASLDGVLALDPVALGALVTATGPIEFAAGEVTGDQVVPLLMLLQYLDAGGYDDPGQQHRREALSAVATAAVDNLERGEWDAGVLARVLSDAAAGRHILAWSRHPEEQRAWEAAQVSGDLEPHSVVFGLHSRGGNKLDQFLDVSGVVATRRVEGGTEVRLEVEIENLTPEGLPQYVAGPYPGAQGGGEGVYQGIAVFEVPAAASEVRIAGGRWSSADGEDDGHQVKAVYVKLRRGERSPNT